MDKLDMQTRNMADENYAALVKLFPNALTEKIVGYDEDGKRNHIMPYLEIVVWRMTALLRILNKFLQLIVRRQ